MFPRQSGAFHYLVVGGIGHNAGKFHHRFPCSAENLHDRIIDTVSLNGAAAIAEHDGVSVTFGQAGQIFFDTALAKIHLR